ncbi:MAG: hypothetical protein WAO74_04635 [Polaribacter sp.]|uniref:hypothetical protein n=1 Tax=Polaribacter sp. TaxID=1920175 RepID=UPI003BB0F32C
MDENKDTAKIGIIIGGFGFIKSTKMIKKLLLVSLVTFLFSISGFSQSAKLDKGKESLKTKTTSSTSATLRIPTSTTTTISTNNQDRTLLQVLFVDIIGRLLAYTAYGAAFESPWEFKGNMHSAEIAHFPYELPHQGNFIYTDSINYNITRFDIYNRFLIENSSLYGNNFGFDFLFFKRFSFNADYVTFSENMDGKKDNFNMYSALLKYHRIRTQKLDAWFGLGATHVASGVNETGFTFGFGGEWFIKKPISLLLSHRTTAINNERIKNTKLLLKYHINNYRISSGYEYYRLGVSKINTFSLGVEVSF